LLIPKIKIGKAIVIPLFLLGVVFFGVIFSSPVHADSFLKTKELDVDNKGFVYKDGKVGIGTSSPAVSMDVRGFIRASNFALSFPTSNTGVQFLTDATSISWTSSFINLEITTSKTLTFNTPSKRGYMLLVTRTSGASITWPANVKWKNNTIPPFKSGAQVDLIGFYFDGVTYNAEANIDLR